MSRSITRSPTMYVVYRSPGPFGFQILVHFAQEFEGLNKGTISDTHRCTRVHFISLYVPQITSHVNHLCDNMTRNVKHRQYIFTKTCHWIDPEPVPYMYTNIPAVYFYIHNNVIFSLASQFSSRFPNQRSVSYFVHDRYPTNRNLCISLSYQWCCTWTSHQVPRYVEVIILIFFVPLRSNLFIFLFIKICNLYPFLEENDYISQP